MAGLRFLGEDLTGIAMLDGYSVPQSRRNVWQQVSDAIDYNVMGGDSMGKEMLMSRDLYDESEEWEW